MGRRIIWGAVLLGCLLLVPLLGSRSGMGGLAGVLVGVWAVLMIYLVGLIVLRLRREIGSEEGRFHTRMAQFLTQTSDPEAPCCDVQAHPPEEKADSIPKTS